MSHSKEYTAAVLVIGNEILSGRTQDTNTNYIATQLTDHGISLQEVRVVPDSAERIIEAVNALRPRYDYVFTTGGIGPTHDDITAECIAAAFGVALEINPAALRLLEDHYGAENLTDARARMARIPAGAALVPNPVSAAPGFHIGNVFVFAGVPRIMQAMMNHVVVNLQGGDLVLSATVSCSLAESVMADDAAALQERYQGEVEVGSYPHFRAGVLGLSLVLRSTSREALKKAAGELEDIIKKKGENPLVCYSFD